MAAPVRPYGPNRDPRFALHHRQPRANKLDAQQRRLCQRDPVYRKALGRRVANEARWSAFLEGQSCYVDIEALCPKCNGFKRRVRDRSCYHCHLNRSGENFERIKAGLAPKVRQSRDGYLDRIAREKAGEGLPADARRFGLLTAHWWPNGKLEVTYPDGRIEPDFSKLSWNHAKAALDADPDMRDLLRWAGWSVD